MPVPRPVRRLAALVLAAGLIWLAVRLLVPVEAPPVATAPAAASLATAELPDFCSLGPTLVEDVSLLNPAKVSVVCRIVGGSDWERSEQQIRSALDLAAQLQLPVSIAAQRHSQGGHVSQPGALLLDLDDYRGVEISESQRGAQLVRVLSGTTWEEVQEAADGGGLEPESYPERYAQRRDEPGSYRPSSLAVKVQQSSNIFSVGGSLSVNCHGRDKDFGPIVSTVRSFRIMLADGRVVSASRKAPPGSDGARLFRAAVGGYGLLGVILDVELELRDNLMVEKHTTPLDYRDYVQVLEREVLPDPGVALHFGRLNIDELDEDAYLREMYRVDFRETPRIEEHLPLSAEPDARLLGSLMEVGEWSDLAKKLRWEALLSRVDVPGRLELTTLNNAMRPPVQFLLERSGVRKVNILQEYFVPPQAFVPFVDGLRATAVSEGIDLQNVTTRFVVGNDEALLSYAPTDRIAVVLYINIWLTEEGIAHGERWTRELVDRAQALGGSYYLAYQRWPTRSQLERSYPQFEAFLAEKEHFDPTGMFRNQFHSQYGAGN